MIEQENWMSEEKIIEINLENMVKAFFKLKSRIKKIKKKF